METINANQFNSNPNLDELVDPDTSLKNILVEYVGESFNPEDKNVTVEMIVEVMAKEFPEFILAIAEENWVRGYEQAVNDGAAIHTEKIEEIGKKITVIQNEKKRSCKLCEK